MSSGFALRVAILGGAALVLFAVIFFRLWYLQVLSGDKYLVEANNNRIREIRVTAPRGEILLWELSNELNLDADLQHATRGGTAGDNFTTNLAGLTSGSRGKSAEEILDSLARYLQRISGAGH